MISNILNTLYTSTVTWITLWGRNKCHCSVPRSWPPLCNPTDCSIPVLAVPNHFLVFARVHVHWINHAIQPSHPLSPSSPSASIFPSIMLFSNGLAVHIRWPKYWSFSFSISPSNEYSGLIFRMDWLDLLAVQGTLKSLLQHHSSKASILRHSAFFTVQLPHPYMTTGKTIALTRWTFVGKVMSLLFNMLFRLVITFLPRSKRLLISWLQSPSAVIFRTIQIRPSQLSTSHSFTQQTAWKRPAAPSMIDCGSNRKQDTSSPSRWEGLQEEGQPEVTRLEAFVSCEWSVTLWRQEYGEINAV